MLALLISIDFLLPPMIISSILLLTSITATTYVRLNVLVFPFKSLLGLVDLRFFFFFFFYCFI